MLKYFIVILIYIQNRCDIPKGLLKIRIAVYTVSDTGENNLGY
jgi:hypothetical protein